MNARAGLETRQIESARVSVVTGGPENRQKQCGLCRDDAFAGDGTMGRNNIAFCRGLCNLGGVLLYLQP